MGLKPKFTNADVQKATKEGALQIYSGIIKTFRFIGEKFVAAARQNLNISGAFPKGDYTDRTTNLRSSIGYFILNNGSILEAKLDGSAEGISAARNALNDIPNKTGLQLVGVAGMDYASHVESKGYNVISSQRDIALVDLQDLLQKFKKRMNAKGVGLEYSEIDSLAYTVL